MGNVSWTPLHVQSNKHFRGDCGIYANISISIEELFWRFRQAQPEFRKSHLRRRCLERTAGHFR